MTFYNNKFFNGRTVILFLLTIITAVVISIPLEAGGLKRVAIFDFINIEKDANFQYIESLVTDSVKRSLKKKFAFKDLSDRKWREIAKIDYIYRKDLYTQTAAMNLGLLTKQDVVISGGYRVKNIKKRGKYYTAIVVSINVLIQRTFLKQQQ